MLIIFVYKYILVLLTLVEFLVVRLSMMIYLVFVNLGLEFYLIYYLVFRVCEGVLGLRLLVMIARFYGGDLYNIFNIRKF